MSSARWLSAAGLLVAAGSAHAGAYIFADANNLDRVAHAQVYSGVGGVRPDLTICLDTSVNPALAAQAEASVIKAVNTFNRQRSIPDNTFAFNANTDIPSGRIDFESTLLHEMGHCQGLAHVNHASESGLGGASINGTKSTVGLNTVFDQGAGTDGRHGSRDDVRSDDVNLHWYIRNQNNPGQLPAIVDTSTMIRALTALPGGHLFAANADRDVMASLGFASTEAVMQQGAFSNEAQRHLQHDDVVTLRLSRAGVDRIAGNADDYTYQMRYVGQLDNPSNANCNLRVRLDTSTGLAVCAVGGQTIGSSNIRITSANLAFNSNTNWYFSGGANTVTSITADTPDPSTPGQAYAVSVTVREVAGISIAGEPRGVVEVTDGVAEPSTARCTITLVGTVNETGSCQLTTSASGTRQLQAQYLGFSGWDASSAAAAHTVQPAGPAATTTTITSDNPDPSVVGQPYTVAVQVSSGGGTPTGTVTISDGSVQCNTPALTGGAASCVLTSTTAASKTLTATYAGNANFAASSGAAPHLVNRAATTTSIISDLPDPSSTGQLVTVVFSTITNAPGAGSPVGTVSVTASGGAETCSASAAVGSCQLALVGLGSRTLSASYAGNVNFAPSVGTAVHTVNAIPTTTTITSDSPDPSVVGQLYAVNVQVGSFNGTPSGTVTVNEGGGSCVTPPLVAGSGGCSLVSTIVGQRTLTATYSGSAMFSASQAVATHTVQKANSATVISGVTPSPSNSNQPVTVSFAVSAAAPGVGVPTGTVVVTVSGGVETCSASSASGSCVLNLVGSGNRTLTASYAGDVRFNSSGGSAQQTVVASNTLIFLNGFE